MSGKADHCTSHLGSWHKTIGRHISHNIRAGIVLNRQRQGSVVLAARSGLHSIRYFFLYHYGNGFYRHFFLEQPHNDRRCNIIWQIRHNLNRSSLVVLLCQFSDIHF